MGRTVMLEGREYFQYCSPCVMNVESELRINITLGH